MSGLTDDELRARLKYAMGERALEPFVEPLRELQHHRAALADRRGGCLPDLPMTAENLADLAALEAIAETAAADVAEYQAPRGTPTWDDERVGRMLARDPVIATQLPIAVAEIRRRRAARAADARRVRAVVREALRVGEMASTLERLDGALDRIADRFAAQLTAPGEGSAGWRAGIEASIRRLEAMGRLPRDLWQPAYFAAVDEALVHLRAMLERGAERVTTPLAGTPG